MNPSKINFSALTQKSDNSFFSFILKPFFWIIAFFVICLLHYLLLEVSPLPWFDEVFFHAIALSFSKNGEFTSSIIPFFNEGKEILIYGPLYFVLTGTSIKLFGTGIFAFRMVNLTFGILTALIIRKIILSGKEQSRLLVWPWIGACLLLIEPLYHSNIHSGRMEGVGLFFLLSAFYVFFKNPEKWQSYVISGILAAFAILTTPRFGVLFIGLTLAISIKNLRSNSSTGQSIFHLSIFGIAAGLTYLPWFIYAFDGSLMQMYEYYTSLSSYLGNAGIRFPTTLWPLLGGVLLVLVLLIAEKGPAYLLSETALFSIISIALFHWVVKITSVKYIALVIPLYLLLLFEGFKLNGVKARQLIPLIIGSLLILYLGIFTLKNIIVLNGIEERSAEQINNFVSKNIPAGSKVVGDHRFYYACVNNDIDFYDPYYCKGKEGCLTLTQQLTDNLKYNYMLIAPNTPKEREKKLEAYFNSAPHTTVDTMTTVSSSLSIPLPDRFKFTSNYDAILYQRVD